MCCCRWDRLRHVNRSWPIFPYGTFTFHDSPRHSKITDLLLSGPDPSPVSHPPTTPSFPPFPFPFHFSSSTCYLPSTNTLIYLTIIYFAILLVLPPFYPFIICAAMALQFTNIHLYLNFLFPHLFKLLEDSWSHKRWLHCCFLFKFARKTIKKSNHWL